MTTVGTILSTPIAAEPPSRDYGRKAAILVHLDHLKTNPDTWYQLATFPRGKGSTASSSVTSLQKAGCEAVSRRLHDGTYGVFARYPSQATAAFPTKTGASKATPTKPEAGPTLVDVAETYTEAVADGGNGTAAICETYGLTRPKARILISQAVKDGLLPKSAA